MKNTGFVVLALAVSLTALLACTTPYPSMPDKPADPGTNVFGQAINYEEAGFARPDNTFLQPSVLEFSNASEQSLVLSVSEDAIYRAGYRSRATSGLVLESLFWRAV
ncbi:MAG: hypothetical protein ACLFO2_02020 [Candidatus Woesearchaeota archaeon]